MTEPPAQDAPDSLAAAPRSRTLLRAAIPAVIIGVISAAILWALEWVAHELQHWMWDVVPATMGFASDSWWWIFGILTLTGVAVGLVVWLAPGHGGTDSATVELVAPVQPLTALPGIAAVIVLGLAGGVSLGPESPIIAINTALAVALIARFLPGVPKDLTITITAAATIGAMFGTPVAAALVFTGLLAARGGGSLWDKLFLPVAAAGAGALTTLFLGGQPLTLGLPAYGNPTPFDLVIGTAIALFGAAVAIVAALIFPVAHRLFHSLGHPMLYITLGGVLLGLLGVLGGPVTLFKGLSEMGQLVKQLDTITVVQLVAIVGIKVLALVVAASSGFRGGRIFPAVFIGAGIGMIGHVLIPDVPLTLAVACGVLGVVLVVARDGWLALFIAVTVCGQIGTLTVLCLIVLPVWLLARKAPEMIVHTPVDDSPAPEPATR